MADLSKAPEQVRKFVEAATANAFKAWGEGSIIAKDIMYVNLNDEDLWVVCDNYEKFFSTIYEYDPKGDVWTTRTMYAGDGRVPRTFDEVMADTECIFTG